jgi:ketopantoate reductase
VICDVDEARPVDWVLLATKAQQTPQAGPWLARLPAGPPARALTELLTGSWLAEAVAVGIAEGAQLGPEDVAATMAFYGQFGEQDGTSMLYDRLAGRELENELISGAITRLGRRHGVPTPANQAMYALLGALGQAQSPG